MSINIMKPKFYSLAPILKLKAQYNVIIGERSNGKTYACLELIIRTWWTTGKQGGYIRRFREDFRGKRGEQLFAGHEETGIIKEITNGEWDRVKYYSGKWYLARHDEQLDKLVYQDTPFCYAFALSEMEHDKSISYPLITTIVFDEFLTRKYYLPDEFVLFMNVLSTIIRHRDDITIFMLANTVNKYAPYFKEMGLTHISEMTPGKIDVYTYGESKLQVAVEYCSSPNKNGKKSDAYFAFDNPSLAMITGGAWEIAMYPHRPVKYEQSDILFIFFIIFNGVTLQGEVVQKDNSLFLFFHRKTTPIQDENKDIIFSEEYDSRPNHMRNIRKGNHPVQTKLAWFFKNDKVFYQDNEVGEVVRNYLMFCASDTNSRY